MDTPINLINNNTAAELGGGITCFGRTDAEITNCTVVTNTSGTGSTGLYINNANDWVAKSILWGNSKDYFTSGASTTYSDVSGGYANLGNINTSPVFSSSFDFHLLQNSPCIDSGKNWASRVPLVDLGNNNRDGAVDMGAYELSDTTGGPGVSGTIWAVIAPVIPPEALGSHQALGMLFLLLRKP